MPPERARPRAQQAPAGAGPLSAGLLTLLRPRTGALRPSAARWRQCQEAPTLKKGHTRHLAIASSCLLAALAGLLTLLRPRTGALRPSPARWRQCQEAPTLKK